MKSIRWSRDFRNSKDSRVQGFQGSSIMKDNDKEVNIFDKVIHQRVIKPLRKSLVPMNPRILEPLSRGFTLIEIVVVIVILAMASSIMIYFLINIVDVLNKVT